MSLDRRIRDELRREAAAIEPDVERHLGAVEARARRRGGIGASTLLLAAAIVVAAIILRIPDSRLGVGPGSSSRPTSVASGSASPALATYPEIAGTYVVTLDNADTAVKRDGVSGSWTMRLEPDGVVFLSPPPSWVPGAAGLSGIAFSLVSDRFRTNLFYNEYCNSIGTYAWSRVGTKLTFTQVDDTCSIRRTLLSTKPWVIGP